MEQRPVQFAPFAVLSSYGDAVQEVERVTDKTPYHGENVRNELNRKMSFLLKSIEKHLHVEVTCFIPDEKKEGGAFKAVAGDAKKIWCQFKYL